MTLTPNTATGTRESPRTRPLCCQEARRAHENGIPPRPSELYVRRAAAVMSLSSRVAQASRVIIRQAPSAVQMTSQAMMTQTATVVVSGMRSGFPLPPLGPPPPPPNTGRPPGVRWAVATPTTARCKFNR